MLQWDPDNTVTNGPKQFGCINVWLFCRAAKTSGCNNEVTLLPRWPQGGVPLYHKMLPSKVLVNIRENC